LVTQLLKSEHQQLPKICCEIICIFNRNQWVW